MFDKQITQEFLDFCGNVWAGVEYADAKHGDWSDEDLKECPYYIAGEVEECKIAALNNDIDGPHGIKAESVQVAVTAFKLWRKVSL